MFIFEYWIYFLPIEWLEFSAENLAPVYPKIDIFDEFLLAYDYSLLKHFIAKDQENLFLEKHVDVINEFLSPVIEFEFRVLKFLLSVLRDIRLDLELAALKIWNFVNQHSTWV